MQASICPVCKETIDAAAVPGTARGGDADTVRCPRCSSVFPRDRVAPAAAGMGSTPFMSPPGGTTLEQSAGESAADLPVVPGYEVLCFLARGGMGMVLKARQPALDRVVAIKLPLGEAIAGEGERERFLREARSAARLRHPHICPIYEVGEVPPPRRATDDGATRRGRPYIAMAYVRGETLRGWVKQANPSAREIAAVMAKLARAVGYAHEHGVVHRDIKPANVMVDAETGEPVLTDFGLAKEFGAAGEGAARVTQSGQLMGTPDYMAPEQAAGRSEEIGPPTDIYALGAVMYDLLTGRPPFLGAVGEVLMQVQIEDPLPLRKLAPRLHRDLETICLKALAKEPADRYASAAALADDLERFGAGEAILARREGLGRKLVRHMKRNARALAVVAAVLVMAGMTVALVAVRASRAARLTNARGQVDSLSAQPGAWGLEAEQYHAVDAALGSLAALSPADATTAAAKVAARDADAIESGIRGLSTLGPDQQKRLDAAIDLLAAHSGSDPAALARVAALRQLLEDRLATMQPVLELRPPYANLGSAFRSGDMEPDPDGLHLVPGNKHPVELCLAPSATDVQIQAVFDVPRDSGGTVGVATNVPAPAGRGKGKDHLGYQFLLQLPGTQTGAQGPGDIGNAAVGPGVVDVAPAPHPDPDPTARHARRPGRVLMILRDGVALRQDDLPPQQPPDGAIRITAWRDGDTLGIQLNDLPRQQFVDVFPLGRSESAEKTAPSGTDGSFGITCTGGALLRELRCFRRGAARAPGPLEHADDLYASGHTADALEEYRAQSLSAPGEETRQAAKYKQATCLLDLKRTDEAAGVLESLASQQGTHWPPLAGCQLWTLRFGQQRMEDADAALNSLRSRYTFEQLTSILPQETRSTMVASCVDQVSGLNVAGIDSARLARLERVVAVEDLLERDATQQQLLRYLLVKTYHATGDYARAALEAERELPNINVGDGDREWSLMTGEQYGWVEILLGDPLHAYTAIDRVLYDPGSHRLSLRATPLLVERARLHLAMNNPGDAAHDLDTYLATLPKPSRISYRYIAGAWLLRGFMLEEKGDLDGATRAWQQVAYNPTTAREDTTGQITMDLTDLQYGVILGGLANSLSDADCQWYYSKFLSGNGSESAGTAGSPIALARAGMIGISPGDLREIWHTARGHDYAKRFATQRLDYAERNSMIPKLLEMEMFRRSLASHATGASEGNFTADQDAVVWDTVGDLYTVGFGHKLGKLQLLQLAAAWKGSLGALGWGGVSPSLAPLTRARLSYLLGLKLRALGRDGESPPLFRAARDGAAPGSALRRVAEAEMSVATGNEKKSEE